MEKSRFRSVFAFTVMLMMIAQSFSPMIAAESALLVPESTSEVATPNENTSAENIDANENVTPSLIEGDSNEEEIPTADNGESVGEESEAIDSPTDIEETIDTPDGETDSAADGEAESADAIEGEADPAGSENAELDADATENNLEEAVDPIVGPELGEADEGTPAISSQPQVQRMASANALPGVTDVTVPPALENVCDNLRVDGTWAVNDPTEGDRFSLTFDSRLQVTPGLPRAMYDRNDASVVIAYMTVAGNVATFELTGAVSDRDQVDGTFWLDSSGCWGESHAGTTVELHFTGSETQTWTRNVDVPSHPVPPAGSQPTKSGAFTAEETITWTVYFPAGSSGGATINDLAAVGWEFVPGSFSPINSGGGIVELAESSTDSITVTVGAYTEVNNPPGFTIKATLVDGWEDDVTEKDDQGRYIFTNTITGTNFTVDNVEVPMEPATAEVSKPLPPVIPDATENPTKSGRFTRPDQGRITPEGAIEWIIYFPAGSSGGATITDTALAGWEFDVDSFEAFNTHQSTAAIDLSVSNEGSITVTVSAYSDESNPPAFRIKANITDQDAVSFENIAYADNTTVGGGELPRGEDDTEINQDEVPPTTSTPAKHGQFTGDETITWTVYFPVGSSNGATIEDVALAGWEFVPGSFQAINSGGGAPELAEGSDESSITVTVGEYIEATNPPGFTIQGTLVDGWEDLVEFDEDRGIFVNVAEVTTVPYGGGDPVTGSVEASVLTPLPPETPETGTDPTKTGEWTNPANQGFDREGAIKWTVHVPHGPASSAVITDEAGDNWEFVCDTDNPANSITLINGWGVESVDVDCTPGKLVVTFTNITSDEWNPVGFTVIANTTVPFADGQGFNNTAFSVINNIDGTVTKEGEVTTEWLVQDSDYGGDGGGASRVLPVNPSVASAVCEDGIDPDPSIELPQNTPDITYSIVEQVDLATGDYVVKATRNESRIWGLLTEGWTVNPDNEHEAIYNGNVEIVPCEVVGLVLPTAEAAVCEGGVEPNPTTGTIVTGEATDIVSYEVTSEIDENGVYVVTATKAADAQWSNDLGEWEAVGGNPNQVTYTGQVTIVPCDPIVPILPSIEGNVCEGGIPEPISVSRPVNTAELTYNGFVVQLDPVNQVYRINGTATIVADGVAWNEAEFEDGWTVTSATVANFSVVIPMNGCTEVVPLMPTLQGNVCEGGEYTDPGVSVPADTAVITYSEPQIEIIDGKIVVTVTAQIPDSGYMWSERQAPFYDGWEVTADRTIALFTKEYDQNLCDEIVPVLPEIGVAVCESGQYTLPAVAFTGGNENITYFDIVVESGEITAAATFTGGGIAWDETDPMFGEGGNWVIVSPTEATYSGTYEENLCEEIAPVLPTVDGNVCEGGAYTPPTVNFGEGIDGVEYEGTAQGGQVTATAMIVDGGIAWDVENLPAGWSPTEDSAVVTYVGTYVEAPCAPVVPANPVVQEAVCVGGALIDPIVTTNNTDRITYTIDGTPVSGGTVNVTATLTDGYEWTEDMPERWTVNPENLAEATFVVELADVECTPVVPELPVVTPAVCEDGKVTPPSIALPTTPGVTYTKSGEEVPGDTVVVTATLEDGKEWGHLPEGWTETSPTTASYEVTLGDYPCEPVVPEVPTITPGVCEDTNPVDPGVELPNTPGITYTTDGEEVPGGTVVITATLDSGYEWGEMPEGWTLVDATTATFTVTLPASPECAPAVQQPSEVTELPSTGSGLENSSLGMMLASITALMAAAVALRINAFKRS